MDDINVGRKVQEFRQAKDISIKNLSEITNITSSMISQIERNQVNPSINSLKSIAKALDIPLYYFFQDDIPEDEMIVRANNRKTIGVPDSFDVTYELLTPDVRGTIEFCLMTIPSKCDSGDAALNHRGEEVAHVMSGSVDIVIGSFEIQTLHTGDSIRIPSLTEHKWINNYDEETKVIFAITPPSF